MPDLTSPDRAWTFLQRRANDKTSITLTLILILQALSLRDNHLTSVPTKIKDINYQHLDLSCNYMNVADGSANRITLDAVTALEKYYLDQLTPIFSLKSSVTGSSIQTSENSDGNTTTNQVQFPLWLFIVISVAAVGGIAAVTVLLVVKKGNVPTPKA